jgi:hypothetical protein
LLRITQAKFRELGLHEKLVFKHRVAIGQGVQKSRAKPPTPKTPEDRIFIAKALEGNANLKMMVKLDQEKLDSMIDISWKQEVVQGKELIRQGDVDADYFYVVQSGSFDVVVDPQVGPKLERSTSASSVGRISKGGSELPGQTELVQVEAGKAVGNVDAMDSMIKSAMKSEMDTDMGESQHQQDKDMANEMKMIEAKEAVQEETEAMQRVDCSVGKWSGWSECSKKCDGGVMSRKRGVLKYDANGGDACPHLEDKKSCNVQSCAEQKAAVDDKIRHLTAARKAEEHAANEEIKERAMGAQSVERMSEEIAHYVKKATKTENIHVLLPGQEPPTDEELIQPLLQKAIAKNTVSEGMKEFAATQKKPAK